MKFKRIRQIISVAAALCLSVGMASVSYAAGSADRKVKFTTVVKPTYTTARIGNGSAYFCLGDYDSGKDILTVDENGKTHKVKNTIGYTSADFGYSNFSFTGLSGGLIVRSADRDACAIMPNGEYLNEGQWIDEGSSGLLTKGVDWDSAIYYYDSSSQSYTYFFDGEPMLTVFGSDTDNSSAAVRAPVTVSAKDVGQLVTYDKKNGLFVFSNGYIYNTEGKKLKTYKDCENVIDYSPDDKMLLVQSKSGVKLLSYSGKKIKTFSTKNTVDYRYCFVKNYKGKTYISETKLYENPNDPYARKSEQNYYSKSGKKTTSYKSAVDTHSIRYSNLYSGIYVNRNDASFGRSADKILSIDTYKGENCVTTDDLIAVLKNGKVTVYDPFTGKKLASKKGNYAGIGLYGDKIAVATTDKTGKKYGLMLIE
ncbi:MAG: hypothetical protein ACI4XA_01800 [Oscillospiraceae bacterium]